MTGPQKRSPGGVHQKMAEAPNALGSFVLSAVCYWFFGCSGFGGLNFRFIQSTYPIGRPLAAPTMSWSPPYTIPATRAALVVRAVMGKEKRSAARS